ncbi:substrate-binding domain-containing protein [Neomoorella humiferrea]|uniref:substrate-binding domain-containing protein n=1 Tax=Neomoorella humiferrea TaxID=676965 RepID=UPI003D8DC3B0
MYKSKRRTVALLIFAFLLAVIAGGCSRNAGQGNNQAASIVGGTSGKESAQKKEIILATTTSTMDTGLLDVLIPMFEKKTGYIVKPNAVGTGQALAMGEQGNADVLLVHAPEAEMELVAKGTVINRRLVMHNDFIIVGPPEDPAGIRGIKKADGAFKQIAAGKALFISRGDDSGTHKMEKKIWQKAGIKPEGKWYQEAGSGMGQTLNIASEKGGYTLTDRGTYLALRKNLKLEVMVEGDRALLNIYHVMQVNQDKFPGITLNSDGAQAFVDFMTDPETQKVIGDFGRDKFGQPLFFPDAGKDEASLGQ